LKPKRRVFRVVAGILMPALVLSSLPLPALAAATDEKKVAVGTPPPPPPKVKVNRTVPKVTPPPVMPTFSAAPTDQEMFKARVFEEPLIPAGAKTAVAENQALAQALLAYVRAKEMEETSSLEIFLKTHPDSPWRVSLLTDLGIVYRKTGQIQKALGAWDEAWRVGKDETEANARAITDRAVGELAQLNARLGRYEALEVLLKEIEGRDIRGSATEKVAGATQGLWLMRNRPHEAFRCGPAALDRILVATRPGYQTDAKIANFASTLQGTSLTQMESLAAALNLPMQMAKREAGAEMPLPAMAHWNAGHFAALIREEGGKYLVDDPTFRDSFWISKRALQEEASGYFLVRQGPLPSGWRAVKKEEGNEVWGKGAADGTDDERTRPNDDKSGPCLEKKGMAGHAFHTLVVSLNIVDTPVGYDPPRGPSVQFRVTYNQRDAYQPAVFSYSNLGPKWTFDWMSYITDNPSAPNSDVYLYLRGGGRETYTFNAMTQTWNPQLDSRAILVRTSPTSYERRLSDGSREIFSQPDGPSNPRKVFMTQEIDARGNALTFTYNSDPAGLQLVSVKDALPGALAQVTTLSYELPSDHLKVTKVTDPFQRSAILEYNPDGRLKKITDVIGITSQFTYGLQDFIDTLTTPYGTTTFAKGENGHDRWIRATDPLGGTERLQYRNEAPAGDPETDPAATVPSDPALQLLNGNLRQAQSLYWDKRTSAMYPGDISKAKVTHWFWRLAGTWIAAGTKKAEKLPLENRVWFSYPGQNGPLQFSATQTQPSLVGRVLDDGTSQIYRYEYNLRGKVIKATDPLNRQTTYVYGSCATGTCMADADQTNGTSIDLLEIRQTTGGINELLAKYTYDTQDKHEMLTATDAAGQTTTYTYTANGDLQTIVTPPMNGWSDAQRTTTYTYYPDNAPLGPGRVQRITGPDPLATTDYTYDSYGRLQTVTDSEGYGVTTDYDLLDRVTKVTYPDTTFEQIVYNRLDAQDRRDRLGRWSHTFYDALRRVVASRDPLGRTVTQQWCNCGSLDRAIDGNGNATSWTRDAQNRMTRETRADNSQTQYIYESTTSRLKQMVDANNQQKNYAYFVDNNLQQLTYVNAQNPTPNVSYTYDANYNRIATRVDGTGTTTLTYNPITTTPTLGAGQLSSIVNPYPTSTVTYGYDELGRVVSTVLNGVTRSQTYDQLGRIASITNPLNVFNNTYVGTTDRMQSVTYPNGQTTTYSYFPNAGDHRLQEIWHKAPGGATLSKFDYMYDFVGNITTWTQQTDSNPAKAYDLGYDSADQLTAATYRTTDAIPVVLKRYVYGYDAAGNRLGEQNDDSILGATYNNMNRLMSQQPSGALRFKGTLDEAATVTIQGNPATVSADNKFEGQAQAPQGASQVDVVAREYGGLARTYTYGINVSGSGRTFTYDPNGNLTGDGTRTFQWDAENRLIRVLQGATELASFTYDGRGRRAQKVAGGVTRTYVYDNDEILEERTSAVTVRYFHGAGIDQQLAAQDTSGTVSYYVADHLGSVVRVTNAAGTVTLTRDYDPYGNPLNGSTPPGYAFTGREWDPETSLYYYRARYYDPKIGRFLSEDPIGDGEQSAYAYADNRPSTLTDPYGLQATIFIQPPPFYYYICCKGGRMTYCAGNTPLKDKCLDDCAREHEKGHIKDLCEKGPEDYCKGRPDGPVYSGPGHMPEKVVTWTECRQNKATWKCMKKCAWSEEKKHYKMGVAAAIWDNCGEGPKPPWNVPP